MIPDILRNKKTLWPVFSLLLLIPRHFLFSAARAREGTVLMMQFDQQSRWQS
jgi:hypothetical protein